MATDVAMSPDRVADHFEPKRRELDPVLQWGLKALKAIASLRVTVVLFVLAIVLVFIGTLAQVDMDIWEVVHRYFRAFYVEVPLQVLFPRSFFPGLIDKVPGWFPFPGGALIGGAMAANLLAAHAIRFKIQARGARMLAGLAVTALGLALFLLVVASGFSHSGILETSLVSWPLLWRIFVGMLVLTWTAMAYGCVQLGADRRWERRFLTAATVLFGAVTLWLVVQGDSARLNDSGMRILWQLVKGQSVALVLLAGCYLLFKKRAGIVLLHGGIGLVMLTEVIVSFWAIEARMQIQEGQTVNYVSDIRTVELAVTDHSDPKNDVVVSIPKPLLEDQGARISDPRLPFDIDVMAFYENSDLANPSEVERNPATKGTGATLAAKEKPSVSGTSTSKEVNLPSAYVRVTDKKSKQDLGVYLCSLLVNLNDVSEKVEVDGKTYDLELRHRRTYKPYSMTLLDFRKDDYVGTSTPKNYSSDVYLLDPSRNVDREKVHIWMNNPLRFAGETFYQSDFGIDPKTQREFTVLSVVSNFGWMIPYVGCMIVGTGMLFQFSNTLLRFLGRIDREAAEPTFKVEPSKNTKAAQRRAEADALEAQSEARDRKIGLWVASATVLLAAAFVTYGMTKPVRKFEEMNLGEFGKLPVAQQGRVKPLDSVARNTLRILSGKLEYTDNDGVRQPAIRWLADMIARPEEAMKAKVFRIDHPELLETLGLERRKLHYYALTEFQDKLDALEKQADAARETREKTPSLLSDYQRKVLELEQKLGEVITLKQAFASTLVRPESWREDAMIAMQREEFLQRGTPPLAVPPVEANGKWTSYSMATFDLSRRELLRAHGGEEAAKTPMANIKIHPAVDRLTQAFAAYSKKDAPTFNREVAAYRSELAAAPPPEFTANVVAFESFFNRAEPFYYASILYLLAFVLAVVGWLVKPGIFQRSAFWLLLFTFGFHTLALVARIYISGRPPVTNLYATAVFIGWACVGLALILEALSKLGICNAVAGFAGFMTLLIAHFLSLDGDTIGVMQAVLDTQFWLATHVVTINLGYATSFLAGLLGAALILQGVFTPRLDRDTSKALSSMIYGVLCFAIFFSFIGTVLGGLWADDSWGRFWGWDPKENGALIIVLWNALVLHARWGKMVGDRGMAVLAVLGNICVAWSWFGVNELGVGLHSYGFTEGVLMWLAIASGLHLLIAMIGLVPSDHWRSAQALDDEAAEAALTG